VVLLDFFAYSCINCQRDQPYLEKWARTYRKAGLEVLGVHSPEFTFERDAGNLAQSLKSEGTTYPVVQDNQLSTWTAYRNRYWPAKYLIDRDGTVRAIKFGEGDYAQTESLIRELLRERDADVALPTPVTRGPGRALAANRTPELYVADNRPGYVGTPKYIAADPTNYSMATDGQPLDTYGLSGQWHAGNDGMVAGPKAQIRLHFRAKDVFHVLGGEGTVRVFRNGELVRTIQVSGPPNLHRIATSNRIVDETLTLKYTAGVELKYTAGVEAFTFSFG
jgi:thiol-disulfide isomerase/thioredoxin